MKNITLDDATCAVPAGVSVVANFEHVSFDVSGVRSQEFLGVVTVDRPPAIAPEIFTDWRQPSERAEVDFADLDRSLERDDRRRRRSCWAEARPHKKSFRHVSKRHR